MTTSLTPDPRDEGHDGLGGHVVVITGAAGAIGRGISTAFGRVGCYVVLVDIDDERLAASAKEISSHLVCKIDVGSAQAVAQLFDLVDAQFGRVDILVNCAGVIDASPFLDIELERWRQVFSVNVDGPLLLMRQAIARMLTQMPDTTLGRRGTVVNVSSGASRIGRPLLASYGASKAALNHLSASAAAAFADELIATIVVFPGQVLEGLLGPALQATACIESRSVDDLLVERRSSPGSITTPEQAAELILSAVATPGMELNGRLVRSDGAREAL